MPANLAGTGGWTRQRPFSATPIRQPSRRCRKSLTPSYSRSWLMPLSPTWPAIPIPPRHCDAPETVPSLHFDPRELGNFASSVAFPRRFNMDTTAIQAAISFDAEPVRRASTPNERGFWSLIVTQFQGAYSDNILRNLLLSMIVGMGLSHNQRETFVSVVTFIFSVPFILLSMPGGWLADHFSKRQITIWTKVMELGSMVVATAGLATHSLALSLAALTLVASQAALFGPSKYGLLPELLPAKRLSWGNGVI